MKIEWVEKPCYYCGKTVMANPKFFGSKNSVYHPACIQIGQARQRQLWLKRMRENAKKRIKEK